MPAKPTMLMGAGPDPWRKALRLALLAEAAYLVYWHVPDATAHTVSLFPWLSGWPLGGWRPGGPGAGPLIAVLYTLCMAAAFAAWGWLLRDLSRRPEGPRDRAIVFGGAALFCLTLVFTPSLLSKDLFDYMGHGRVLVEHGANPFVTPASAYGGDRFTAAMGWVTATPLYGPAWASLVAALTLAGAGSFTGTALLFKLLFASVHLLNGWLVMTIVRGWRLTGEPATGAPAKALRAAAFYLWNPLVLTQTIADAHNDGVALLWLLVAILLLQRRDDMMGAACAAMSVLVKYVTAPALILLLVQRWRASGWAAAAKLAVVGALVAVVAYLPYLSGFDAGHFLRPYEHSSYQGGLMMGLEMALSQLIGGGTDPGSPVAAAMKWISLAAAALLVVWYLVRLAKTRTLLQAAEASGAFLLYYLLGVTALLRTSYLVWIVGLLAVAGSAALRRVGAVFTASVLALEVFWVYRLLADPASGSLNVERFLATLVAVGVPILYLLAHLRPSSGRMQPPVTPAREE